MSWIMIPIGQPYSGGFKLKEYEVVKKAYTKNRPPAEIADWLDISIEKVKSIIEAIKKEGEN